MADLCPECGANPCYRICPTQDPYQGDQQRENEDYEFNARFDDQRERYAATAEDADIDAAAEEAWSKDHPDDQAYIDKGETIAAKELRRAVVDSVSEDDIPF